MKGHVSFLVLTLMAAGLSTLGGCPQRFTDSWPMSVAEPDPGGESLLDTARALAVAPGGGFVLAGESRILTDVLPFPQDAILAKTSANGEILWWRTYGDGYWPTAFEDVKPVTTGGYIAVGVNAEFEDDPFDEGPQFFVVRVDEDGDEIWSTVIGDDSVGYTATAVECTDDGDFIVAGGRFDSDSGNSPYLAILDANGAVRSERILLEGVNGSANSVVPDGEDFVVAGTVTGVARNHIFVMGVDAGGNTLWTESLMESTADLDAVSAEPLPDDRYAIGGTRSSLPDESDFALWIVDAEFSVIVSRTYDCFRGDDEASAMAITPEGDYVLAGTTRRPLGARSFVVKAGPDGAEKWSSTYGEETKAADIIPLEDGELMVGGGIRTRRGIPIGIVPIGLDFDMMLLKLEPNGSVPP